MVTADCKGTRGPIKGVEHFHCQCVAIAKPKKPINNKVAKNNKKTCNAANYMHNFFNLLRLFDARRLSKTRMKFPLSLHNIRYMLSF